MAPSIKNEKDAKPHAVSPGLRASLACKRANQDNKNRNARMKRELARLQKIANKGLTPEEIKEKKEASDARIREYILELAADVKQEKQ
jgi:hypothetical protein